MNELNLTTILTVTAVVTSTLAMLITILMFQYRAQHERRYNEESQRAQLEMLRASLEKKIYELTDRLAATDARWRDINHLLITSQKTASQFVPEPSEVPLTEFLKSAGVTEADLEVDKDLVFVLTPFHPDYWETFQAIASVCQEVGLKCLRGDEENVAGDILHHILRLLAKARVVVANVDGRSPNVFYELGIAHAIDKGVILVSSSVERLPIDVRARRIVIYDGLTDLKTKIKGELIKALVRE